MEMITEGKNKEEEDCSNIDALHFETATIVVLVIVDPRHCLDPCFNILFLSIYLSLFPRFLVYTHEVNSLPNVHYTLKRGYEILLRFIKGSNLKIPQGYVEKKVL